MKRFVSWAAVSSLPQAQKVSLDDQLATNRQHITRWGGTLVEELQVPGESRSIILLEDACQRLPAYARLKALIEARAFDVLIFLDRSRLGRKASLSMAIIELCHDHGIATYETRNPPTSLAAPTFAYDDMLLGAIKSVGAQREVQTLIDRHKMGMIARTERGEIAAHAAYGYRLRVETDGERPSRSMEPDSATAPIVRMIFGWYLDGAGETTIMGRLNAMNVPAARGGVWRMGHVRQLLDRVWRYAGYAEINARSSTDRPYIRARGRWEAIIDEDTALQVAAERRARQHNTQLADTPYLLSGLVYCQVCGQRLVISASQRSGRPQGQVQVSLFCRGAHANRFIAYSKCLKAVRAAVSHLQTAANLDDVAAHMAASKTTLEDRMAETTAALHKALAALDSADEAYLAGLMDLDRYQRQVRRCEAQIADLQAQHDALRDELAHFDDTEKRRRRIDEAARLGLAMLDSADATAANAWLRRHLKVWVAQNAVVEVEYL